MGKPTGFLEYKRETAKVLPPKVRIANFNEFRTPLSKEKQTTSGSTLHGMRRSFLSVRNDAWWNGFRLSAAQPCTGDK